MKTKEDIRKVTPLSVTSTDNAVFEVLKTTDVVVYDPNNRKEFKIQTIEAGTLLRLLGCKQGANTSPYRWGDAHAVVRLDNLLTKFTPLGGMIGEYADDFDDVINLD